MGEQDDWDGERIERESKVRDTPIEGAIRGQQETCLALEKFPKIHKDGPR